MTEIDRRTIGMRALLFAAALAVPGAVLPGAALALEPRPAPLKEPATITVAFGKFSFAAPLLYVPEILKEMNIEMKGVEFQRYADTRTAIATKQADIGMTGGTLLVQSLAGGNTDLIALMGVAGEKIYPVVREGVKIDTWADLKGKKIAAAVGGNVWTQWVAKLVEEKIAYGDLQVSGIQGGGQNFNIALKRGDIDVAILWSPFNAMPIVEGYAYWPKALEFGMSQPVGGEQGIWTTHKDVLKEKRDLIERFLWAYKAAEARIAKSEATKADAIEKFTGVKPEVAKAVAELTVYGAQATPASLEAMAKLMAQQGIVNKDVSAMIPGAFDTSLAKKVSGD
ncbi:ABC transporter substrate-binding protein [Xanthobacter dioxanivorans]|uniref:ABC transporter substrate-binding protein n=1 Tax=Xanthobacter dioxanivorans TaxID=2528964 RepID=A0A974PM05_9HYPH|nr:ABC transporter substrate-binding protein [Xanthobacter dioxanivorans]QRG06060.1 ABC transporter substrate-binding protein [Xanthobacter dioxanivorans]